MTKTCTKCGEKKLLDEFNRNKKTKDGRKSFCKFCAAKQQDKYRKENRELLCKKSRKYYKENREDILKKQKNRKKNPSKKRRERDGREYCLTSKQSDIVEHSRINGKCYACGVTATEGGIATMGGLKKLYLDHYDENGKFEIRGILCCECNKEEGYIARAVKTGRCIDTGFWKEWRENPPGIPGVPIYPKISNK